MNSLIMFAAGNVVLTVIFWILILLALIGAFIPDEQWPYIGRGRWVIVLVLLAILGISVFGNPMNG